MSDTSVTALSEAAESYAAGRIEELPPTERDKRHRLLLEIAFMKGAQWYQSRIVAAREIEVASLQREIEEIVNA